MPHLPRPNGLEMIRFLERHGFRVVRIKGSHDILQSPTSRTTIPLHGHEALKIGTLRGILRDIRMSPQEFARLWAD